MTLDNLPYIGYIKNNLILATGYNTWGMTNGFLAGIIIKDLLNKKEKIDSEEAAFCLENTIHLIIRSEWFGFV